MDYWHNCFKHPITPKRGPMPQMFARDPAAGVSETDAEAISVAFVYEGFNG